MLNLKNIKKSYTVGDFSQLALKGIDLRFRKSEFVAILGPSGSGKTTCLNIIGGLDQYDGGDLIINGKTTKDFKDKDWDAYRNNSVGFIFQSYNLISHLSLIDNVEMGMSLSGVPSIEKRKKALDVLQRVGLKSHVHKRPNQLSGGQMQRVAIARALANDPDIILADEPTGALDTKTSKQIMELIKEIAKDKLVIMVTHAPELAESYADRIVKFKDGKIVDDSNPYLEENSAKDYLLRRTNMNFLTALKLSGKNIATKKWRTALTAFASSIGIIGIALILSLSNGFQQQINTFQADALTEFPIIISQSVISVDAETIQAKQEEQSYLAKRRFPDSDELYLFNSSENTFSHTNIFSDEFLNHLYDMDSSIINSIGYTRLVNMNILREIGDDYVSVSFGSISNTESSMGLSSFPETFGDDSVSYLESKYDILAGSYPTTETEIVIVVDEFNRLDYSTFEALGFDTSEIENFKFSELLGTEFRLITNNNFFTQTEFGNFIPSSDLEGMYNSENSMTLTISGVVRVNSNVNMGLLNPGIAYSDNLIQHLIDIETESDIVQAQREVDYNILSMEAIDEETKNMLISTLGGDVTPFMIYIYPENFESKDAVISHLDEFNATVDQDYRIIYTDLANTMAEMTGGIMSAITLVLIAFSAISLVVSLIMIAIITYISVIERTKEIGVLRALGARKKDITRVFNAETFIIGICSGVLAILITYLLKFPINNAIESATGLSNVAMLNPLHSIVLILISLGLTLLGGVIPARMAAKKDPVEALRSE